MTKFQRNLSERALDCALKVTNNSNELLLRDDLQYLDGMSVVVCFSKTTLKKKKDFALQTKKKLLPTQNFFIHF